MALSKRGNIYWYDFTKNGKRHQGSTGLSNKKKAAEVEAKLKTDLVLSGHGIRPAKPCPALEDFLRGPFLRHVRQHHKNVCTERNYRYAVERLLEWPDWRRTPLNDIADMLPLYIDSRAHLAPDSINAELRTLRKALLLATEQKLAPRVKVKLVKGSKGRKFVLSGELEKEYLAAASYPLREAAILILDLGIRPQECVSLKKADIGPDALMVWDGKSGSRPLPLTRRAAEVIELLFALHPDSPWLFPGRNGKHLARTSLTSAHIRLRAQHPAWPPELKLYSSRHTFGTRLAESSGGNPFQIKALMGHSSVTTSEKYIHTPSEELSLAMKRKEALDAIIRGEKAPTYSTTPASKLLKRD